MPSITLPVSLRGQLLYSTRIFNPVSLFAANEPGVWYDPSDVANLNWRRNLLTFTEQFDNAAWTKTNSSITANAVSAPDGTTTADKLVENTANSTHTASQAFTTSASTSYTFTVYAKADTRSHLDLSALTGFTTNPIVRFTLSGSGASSVRQGSPTPTHSIQSVGDGWYRCQINVTTVAGGSSTFQVALAVDASSSNFYTGDGTSGLFLWGAQLELGSVATDYQRITDVNTEVIERFPTATLYQDTAGTTPVTTPGQTVALALDKSKGLVLGSELVTNGDFSNGTTGWTAAVGSGTLPTLSLSSNRLRIVANENTQAASAYASITTIVGRTYSFSAQRFTVTPNSSLMTFAASTSTTTSTANFLAQTGTAGNTCVFVATGTTTYIHARISGTVTVGDTWEVDNISVKELPGFHATQATAASRPTYGIVPRTGRRNLLTWSEDFSNAAWVTAQAGKSSTTEVVAAIANAPLWRITEDTATNRHEIRQNIPAATIGQNYVLTVYAKQPASNSRRYLQVFSSFTNDFANFDLQSGTVTAGVGSITFVGSGVYRLQVPMLAASAGTIVYFALANSGTLARAGSYTGDGVSNLLITGAQLETGSTATAYQRVGSAFDVTEAGVASLSYLSFDGVDDFMVTPTITPGIDKVTVGAGVRKLSDAATGMIAEFGNLATPTSGSWRISAANAAAADYSFASRGTLTASATFTNASVAAPNTSVLTGIGDIAADVSRLRVNGAQVAQSTDDQGAVNYLAYPLYIGRRGGTSLPFNGQLYSLVVRFASTDLTTVGQLESWINGKTGAY